MSKTIVIERDPARGIVTATVQPSGLPLDPRRWLRDHAAGFEYGYEGSGPNQLSLAICVECCGEHVGLRVYLAIASRLIGRIDHTCHRFEVKESDVCDLARRVMNARDSLH